MCRRALVVVVAVLFFIPVGSAPNAVAQSCSREPTGLVPLTELGTDTYLGRVGGLYADGTNAMPADHLSIGIDQASRIEPLDESGNTDAGGTIGLVSIGVSNTRDEFAAFIEAASDESSDVNPKVAMVNGAQGARDLNSWANGPSSNPWRNLGRIVEEARLAPAQIQVAWVMVPDRSRGTVSLHDIPGQVDRMTEAMTHLKTNYPNIRLAYLSSRIYGGHSPRGEPGAYQHGFTVKSFVDKQISGDPALNSDPGRGQVVAPWVAWGPYTWADGPTPRDDGLTWDCEDFKADGIHPSPAGAEKVAALLMEHFGTHPTASSWFPRSGTDTSTTTSAPVTTTTTATPATNRDTAVSTPAASPPPTSHTAVETSPPTPVERGVDVPWVLGGVALGLVLSLGAAWHVAPRRPSDEA